MTAEHDTLLKHLRGVQHIVINDCHGGFGLSATAIERYHDIMNRPSRKNFQQEQWLKLL